MCTHTYGDLEGTSERMSSAGIISEMPNVASSVLQLQSGEISYMVGQDVK